MKKGLTPEELYEVARLKDLYGGLLPERQREVIHLKLDEDLSLSEISERLGISRQGCEDALKRCYKALSSYEERLGVRRKEVDTANVLSKVAELLSSMDEKTWETKRNTGLSLLNRMLGGEK